MSTKKPAIACRHGDLPLMDEPDVMGRVLAGAA